jgi:hypothetical protein
MTLRMVSVPSMRNNYTLVSGLRKRANEGEQKRMNAVYLPSFALMRRVPPARGRRPFFWCAECADGRDPSGARIAGKLGPVAALEFRRFDFG